MNNQNQKNRTLIRGIFRLFVVLFGLALVQSFFTILSHHVKWSDTCLVLGGWVTCSIYFNVKHKI